MTSHGKPWTGAQQIRLGRLIASGMPVADVAAALGRTAVAVDGRRKKLHIRLPVRPLRSVCEGAEPRIGRVVDVLRSAEVPLRARDIAAAVYGEASDAGTKTVRVLVHNLRRRGVPVASVGRGYVMGAAA
ncbi:helix-turn-helix domain-containing protein [Aureimonas sp. AU40]|uniref:helix-turn-helix domain-containing protein n=1 Tax=Aureimonas sp. AU40 TaxID=1637747 RepID=UPI000782A8BA|nr:helix-turn-helix domain-containing protein [Aureimonas sp. AU40]